MGCCGLGCGCFTFTGLYLVGFVVVLCVVALCDWYTVCFFVVWFLFLGLLAGCFAWRGVLWCVVVGVFLGYVYCVGVRVLVFAWLGFAVARLLCLFCRLRLLEFEFGR